MANKTQYKGRLESLSAIFSALRQTPQLTRRELCERLPLSWGGVSELCAALLECGAISEGKAQDSESTPPRGRTPTRLFVSPSARFLGVDINRTGITLCLTDAFGNEVLRRKTPPPDSPKELPQYALQATKSILSETDLPVLGIGVAMQGKKTEGNEFLITYGGQTLIWNPTKDFCSAFSLPVTVHHDPDCMLYSLPVEKNREGVLMVRLDRGVGLSVCRHGNLLSEFPLELGKTVFRESGACKTLEEAIGIGGLEQEIGKPLTSPEELFGDEKARGIFSHAGILLGTALGNLCHLIPVSKVAICGELTRFSELFLPAAKTALREVIGAETPPVSVHSVTDAALGAARFAVDEFPRYLQKGGYDTLARVLFPREGEG